MRDYEIIRKEIATLQIEKELHTSKLNKLIKEKETKLSVIIGEIKEIQKPKFKTAITWANYIAVLMKNGDKIFTRDYLNLDIERELNENEYYDFVQEKGFVVGAKISHWTNAPLTLTGIVKGQGGYVQPSFWRNTNPTKHFPHGSLAQLYDHQLVVDNPTEFWHYNPKRF